MKITCVICHEDKDVDQYSWRNKEKRIRHGFCKDCHSRYRHEHYIRNKKKYLDKARRWNKAQTAVLRNFILSYFKNHPCIDCGNTDLRVLDFDHEGEKNMNICYMIRNCYSVDAVKKEIALCSVRCANCHRIKTFRTRNYWKNKIGL